MKTVAHGVFLWFNDLGWCLQVPSVFTDYVSALKYMRDHYTNEKRCEVRPLLAEEESRG